MTDIKLSEDFELTVAATGDAPVTNNLEGFLQALRIEALTQEGELFFDEKFGWSLLDFIQAPESELVKIELESRIKSKLSEHEEIFPGSIHIEQEWTDETLAVLVRFNLLDETEHSLTIHLDRVGVTIL